MESAGAGAPCSGDQAGSLPSQPAAGPASADHGSEPARRTPAEPPPQSLDFVCEADVRAAIKDNRKLYIGPKSIVTPSARDLAGPDILVLVQG